MAIIDFSTWAWTRAATKADGEPNPRKWRHRFLYYTPGVNTIYHALANPPGSIDAFLNLFILLAALLLSFIGGMYGSFTHGEILQYDADRSPGGMYDCMDTPSEDGFSFKYADSLGNQADADVATHYFCRDLAKKPDGHPPFREYKNGGIKLERLLEIGEVCVSTMGGQIATMAFESFCLMTASMVLFAIVYTSQTSISRQKKLDDQMTTASLREIKAWWSGARWIILIGCGALFYGIIRTIQLTIKITKLKAPDVWKLHFCEARISASSLQTLGVNYNVSLDEQVSSSYQIGDLKLFSNGVLGTGLSLLYIFGLLIPFVVMPLVNNMAESGLLSGGSPEAVASVDASVGTPKSKSPELVELIKSMEAQNKAMAAQTAALAAFLKSSVGSIDPDADLGESIGSNSTRGASGATSMIANPLYHGRAANSIALLPPGSATNRRGDGDV